MDWSKPALADAYTTWPTNIQGAFADLGKGLDPASVSYTGTIPTNTVRFNASTFRWEKYNGTSWVELIAKASAAYDIRVDTADKLNSQLASYYLNASNIVSGTLAVARGGTNITTYTTGDLVQASGATTLSALAAVATGNALISGGVGAVSSWGKIGLTTHVSGTLAVGNGGTGITSYTAGDFINALNSTTLQTRTAAQVKTALSLVKADVGLGSVDNTSDASKPISTATQTALDLKAPKSLPWEQHNSAYTLVASDNNKMLYTDDATGNVAWTVDASVHATGDLISGTNDKTTSGNITLTQGTSFTLQWGTSTGTRTIARGGTFTLAFKSASKAVLTGSGIS